MLCLQLTTALPQSASSDRQEWLTNVSFEWICWFLDQYQTSIDYNCEEIIKNYCAAIHYLLFTVLFTVVLFWMLPIEVMCHCVNYILIPGLLSKETAEISTVYHLLFLQIELKLNAPLTTFKLSHCDIRFLYLTFIL